MKTIVQISMLLIFIQLILINPIYALEISNRNEYLLDIRGDDGDIYLNKLSIHKKLDSPEIEISAFGEGQWNLDTDEWEKVLLGLEMGRTFWEYFYIGQSIQFISGEMLDYMAFSVNSNSIDTTTKIALNLSLAKDLSFRAFEEYSLNIEKGRDEFSETGVEIVYKFKDSHSVGIGWRHTDRIHNFDTDYISSSITLRF
ncbi:hypothetical protein ACFL0P_03240 [Candidatus Omnitrophota bacterium]